MRVHRLLLLLLQCDLMRARGVQRRPVQLGGRERYRGDILEIHGRYRGDIGEIGLCSLEEESAIRARATW